MLLTGNDDASVGADTAEGLLHPVGICYPEETARVLNADLAGAPPESSGSADAPQADGRADTIYLVR